LKPDYNLKKRIENIGLLIEGWCKKKLVFAYPLLPFGTVDKAYRTLHTFANRTNHPTIQNLQKSAILATLTPIRTIIN
jgi:hypothetical protein